MDRATLAGARRSSASLALPLVVDGQGVVRFQSHGLDDVLRQVHLLQGSSGS